MTEVPSSPFIFKSHQYVRDRKGLLWNISLDQSLRWGDIERALYLLVCSPDTKVGIQYAKKRRVPILVECAKSNAPLEIWAIALRLGFSKDVRSDDGVTALEWILAEWCSEEDSAAFSKFVSLEPYLRPDDPLQQFNCVITAIEGRASHWATPVFNHLTQVCGYSYDPVSTADTASEWGHIEILKSLRPFLGPKNFWKVTSSCVSASAFEYCASTYYPQPDHPEILLSLAKLLISDQVVMAEKLAILKHCFERPITPETKFPTRHFGEDAYLPHVFVRAALFSNKNDPIPMFDLYFEHFFSDPSVFGRSVVSVVDAAFQLPSQSRRHVLAFVKRTFPQETENLTSLYIALLFEAPRTVILSFFRADLVETHGDEVWNRCMEGMKLTRSKDRATATLFELGWEPKDAKILTRAVLERLSPSNVQKFAELPFFRENINASTPGCSTPLHAFVDMSCNDRRGSLHIEVMHVLLRAGADPNLVVNGSTAFLDWFKRRRFEVFFRKGALLMMDFLANPSPPGLRKNVLDVLFDAINPFQPQDELDLNIVVFYVLQAGCRVNIFPHFARLLRIFRLDTKTAEALVGSFPAEKRLLLARVCTENCDNADVMRSILAMGEIDLAEQVRDGKTLGCIALDNGRENLVKILFDPSLFSTSSENSLAALFWMHVDPKFNEIIASLNRIIRYVLEKMEDYPPDCFLRVLADGGERVWRSMMENKGHDAETVQMVCSYLRRKATCDALGPLCFAAATRGRSDYLTALLREDCVDFKDGAGNSLFLCAARSGRTEMLKALKDRGAAVDGKNEQGESAVLLAGMSGSMEALLFLMESAPFECTEHEIRERFHDDLKAMALGHFHFVQRKKQKKESAQ
jgi:hypothetical protein